MPTYKFFLGITVPLRAATTGLPLSPCCSNCLRHRYPRHRLRAPCLAVVSNATSSPHRSSHREKSQIDSMQEDSERRDPQKKNRNSLAQTLSRSHSDAIARSLNPWCNPLCRRPCVPRSIARAAPRAAPFDGTALGVGGKGSGIERKQEMKLEAERGEDLSVIYRMLVGLHSHGLTEVNFFLVHELGH